MPSQPPNKARYRAIPDVELGDEVLVNSFTNVYGCTVGSHAARIRPLVEMESSVTMASVAGARASHSSAMRSRSSTKVFVGHGVAFINDKGPRATTDAAIPSAPTIGRSFGPSSSARGRSDGAP